MKYRNITLNGNKGNGDNQLCLVKYEDQYQNFLEELKQKNFDSMLVDSAYRCPAIYSELSEHQCYMILCNHQKKNSLSCLGAIYIGTSCDERNLEIELQLDEEKFRDEYRIFQVTEQIVDSLGVFFYEKENIEVKLHHDMDLTKFNKRKYKRNQYEIGYTAYQCLNGLYSVTIPAILNEITRTAECLPNGEDDWIQRFHMCDADDYNSLYDKKLLEEYESGTIPFSEIFYKAESLIWENVNSNRAIIFSRNGQINFTKKSSPIDDVNYEFNYNILKYGFHFKTNLYKNSSLNDSKLEINENGYFTQIQTDRLKIMILEQERLLEGKIRKVECTSKIVNNFSAWLKLSINEQEEVETCYVEFRTYQRNGKVNGTYAFRILPRYDKFHLEFISRKGIHQRMETTSDFSTRIQGKLTIDFVDEMIQEVVPIINNRLAQIGMPFIDQENKSIILECKEETDAIIHYIKQLREEIPLPHLQKILERFVRKNESVKNNSKKRILKDKK